MAYQDMAAVYHQLFPVQEGTVQYLKKLCQNRDYVDLACGNGGYTERIHTGGNQRGLGIDNDLEMIRMAQQIGKEGISFRCDDMVHGLEGIADQGLIYCIGNSIVHLDGPQAITQFLRSIHGCLAKEGVAVIGLLNYDRILQKQIMALPLIEDAAAGIVFERTYTWDGPALIFHTRLTVGTQVMENDVVLYPLTHEEMAECLKAAGFTSYQCYGGFNEQPFQATETYTTVWCLKKTK